tara:strand:+ start:172 stop:429 length:258 start_codon:yes stop_codon:yes gene_type:complete
MDILIHKGTMKEKIYNFHSDCGHGYLEVDVKELHDLGIYNEITHYSYINNQKVYLEEDCDASLFIEAWSAENDKESMEDNLEWIE